MLYLFSLLYPCSVSSQGIIVTSRPRTTLLEENQLIDSYSEATARVASDACVQFADVHKKIRKDLQDYYLCSETEGDAAHDLSRAGNEVYAREIGDIVSALYANRGYN